MGRALVKAGPTLDPEIMQEVMVKGDLTKLTPEQRLSYYVALCQSLGLNPATQPFGYFTLNGKSVLYAKKDCTDQLRKIHKISIEVKERIKDVLDGVVAVTAVATDTTNGRKDEAIGAVPILKYKKKEELDQGERPGATFMARGEDLANAMMKAETKAKRRVTLSICGLGLMDETELETVPQAKVEDAPLPGVAGVEYASKEQVRYLLSKLDEEEAAAVRKKYRVVGVDMLTGDQARELIMAMAMEGS